MHAACAFEYGLACVFGHWAYDSGLVSVLCVGCSSVAQALQNTLSVTSTNSHSDAVLQRAYSVSTLVDARV
jgi:hypothetical protein